MTNKTKNSHLYYQRRESDWEITHFQALPNCDSPDMFLHRSENTTKIERNFKLTHESCIISKRTSKYFDLLFEL